MSDGTVVAEWLTRRGYNYIAPETYPACSPWYGAPLSPRYTETRVPDRFLRLTFGSDGRLAAWKRIAR
jgi:hypothetical protein